MARLPPPWHKQIVDHFDRLGNAVYSRKSLARNLRQLKEDDLVPQSLSPGRFAQLLFEKGSLREILLTRVDDSSSEQGWTKLVWANPSAFLIGLSLRSGSYLSHSTALFLRGLTDNIPATIYVNKEQTPKPKPSGGLSPSGIDRAFSRAPRRSKYVWRLDSSRFVLLSGKNSGQLEVKDLEYENGELLRVTSLERSLIDVVVRPVYGGGGAQIQNAFSRARNQISVNILVATLKRLDYAYPYHQSIGFFMERSGYGEKQLAKLEALGLNYDFYLDYKMGSTEFDKRWRLFYPKGF